MRSPKGGQEMPRARAESGAALLNATCPAAQPVLRESQPHGPSGQPTVVSTQAPNTLLRAGRPWFGGAAPRDGSARMDT